MKIVDKKIITSHSHLKTYYMNGNIRYSAIRNDKDIVNISGLHQSQNLLHSYIFVHQTMMPPTHHLREKQQFLAITLIDEGAELVRSNNVWRIAEASDIILMHHNHDIEFMNHDNKPCTKMGVCIGGNALEQLLLITQLDREFVIPNLDKEHIKEIFNAIYEDFHDAEKNATHTFTLLQFLANQIKKENNSSIDLIKKYIDQHLSEELSLEVLSSKASISVAQLVRLSKIHLGISIHRYIRNQRMYFAKQLLQSGQFSVKEIAYKTGYNNPYNFSTEFRKFYGKSPKKL